MERQWLTLDQIKAEYASNDYNPEMLLQHLLHHVEASPASVPEDYAIVPVEILDRFPEINPSNYDHDGACALNAWGVELVLSAAPTPPVSDERKDAPQEDYFADACRLALELECLLLDCKDTAVTAKWWDSAHEALEQHRERIAAMQEDKP